MNIKKLTLKQLSWALLPALIIGFTACGDKDETTPTPTTPAAKTLNKTSLTNNKKWYSKGGAIFFDFKPNGQYHSSGTWRWINNTDTMETIGSTGTPLKYLFLWNTETELECSRVLPSGVEGPILMKTTEWQ